MHRTTYCKVHKELVCRLLKKVVYVSKSVYERAYLLHMKYLITPTERLITWLNERRYNIIDISLKDIRLYNLLLKIPVQ